MLARSLSLSLYMAYYTHVITHFEYWHTHTHKRAIWKRYENGGSYTVLSHTEFSVFKSSRSFFSSHCCFLLCVLASQFTLRRSVVPKMGLLQHSTVHTLKLFIWKLYTIFITKYRLQETANARMINRTIDISTLTFHWCSEHDKSHICKQHEDRIKFWGQTKKTAAAAAAHALNERPWQKFIHLLMSLCFEQVQILNIQIYTTWMCPCVGSR